MPSRRERSLGMFCPNCGTQIPDDSVFCEKCGFRLAEGTEEQDGHSLPEPQQSGRSGLAKYAFIGIGAAVLIGAVILFAGKGGRSGKEPDTAVVSAQAAQTAQSSQPDQADSRQSSAADVTQSSAADVTQSSAADISQSSAASVETAASEPAMETVTGGEWIEVASVWFYQKDGELVKDSWIDDNGTYYYVDDTGYMLRNAYTPDGYFVGADGSYDPAAPENQPDGGKNALEGTPKGEALAAIAGKLSTDEPAYATEFDWFIDYVNSGGKESGRVITDESLATRITDLQPALNGGWKAFIFTENGVYGSDVERYLHADVEASGGKFNITLNWKYLVDPAAGETIEETGSATYRGTYDDLEGTAAAETSDSRVEFDAFYLAKDGEAEYATGTFRWISGEIDRIALMRRSRAQ